MDYFGDINVYGYNSKIYLNPTPNYDNPFNGFVCNDYVDSTVKYGDIVHFDILTGTWRQSCGNDINSIPARGVACSDYVSMLPGGQIPILMYGYFFWDSHPELITDSVLWLSDTIPGRFTNLQPNTIGNFVQVLGTAKTQQIFFFDFCPFYIQIG